MAKNLIKIPLKLEHVKVKSVEYNNNEYHVYVACTATSTKCHKCGQTITKSHGQCNETIVEHMPIFDEKVFIHVKWPRFICDKCDNNPTTSFHPDWLNDTGTHSRIYEDFFLKMIINSTLKDVAIKFGVTEEILQGMIDRRVSTEIDWKNYNPTQMGIDEIALRKGHKHYLTIITDISTKKASKIIAVLDGRKKEDIIRFFKSIPRQKILNLSSICIDMGASYFSAIKEVINNDYIFNNVVIIDRFHVAKLIGKSVDDERKKIVRDLKKKYAKNKSVLESIKGTMWPFRHHYKDLSLELQDKLDNLFSFSSYLEECYDLREELYLIFESNYSKEEAKVAITNWSARALECKNNDKSPFYSFIKTFTAFMDNILNYFENRCTSGAVEGLNNKIKVIKRRGFGFRNVHNFTKRLVLDINLRTQFIPAI